MTDTPQTIKKTEHTPGPWRYELRQGMYPAVEIGGKWQRIYVPPPLHGVKECEANARLLAAAPELLAACKAIHDLDMSELYPDGLLDAPLSGQLTAAIAKAEGRQP